MLSRRLTVRTARSLRLGASRQHTRYFVGLPRPEEPRAPRIAAGDSLNNKEGQLSQDREHGHAPFLPPLPPPPNGTGVVVLSIVGLLLWCSLPKSNKNSLGNTAFHLESTVTQLKIHFIDKEPDLRKVVAALKRQVRNYAVFIPGGRAIVDNAFQDLEKLRQTHGADADIILREAYTSLRNAASKEKSMDIVPDTWNALSKMFFKLSKVAAGAGRSRLHDFPEIQAQLGLPYFLLRQVRDSLGPDAQDSVGATLKDIEALVNQYTGPVAVFEMWALAKEQFQLLQPMRDQIWRARFSKMASALEKHPDVKRVVDRNIFTLKHSDTMSALEEIHAALLSGHADDLQGYIDRCKPFWPAYRRPSWSFAKAKPSRNRYSFGVLNAWMRPLSCGSGIIKELEKLQQRKRQVDLNSTVTPRLCGNCEGTGIPRLEPPSF